ncbi:hypothetical protein L579_1266 [Pantoea sp. AS-PWVM4]|nr:hypothetical protein L579_1266 [Pantoea sp. AS-PWVM4]
MPQYLNGRVLTYNSPCFAHDVIKMQNRETHHHTKLLT